MVFADPVGTVGRLRSAAFDTKGGWRNIAVVV